MRTIRAWEEEQNRIRLTPDEMAVHENAVRRRFNFKVVVK